MFICSVLLTFELTIIQFGAFVFEQLNSSTTRELLEIMISNTAKW